MEQGPQTDRAPRVLRARPRRRGRRLSLSATAPAWAAAGLATVGEGPRVGFRPPESRRAAIVSGGVAALIHTVALVGLALLAWLAPEVVEELIVPVHLLEEPVPLRGTNTPTILAPPPRIDASALALQKPIPSQALRPIPAALAPERLRATPLEAMRAPTRLDQVKLSPRQLAAPSIQPLGAPARMDVATLRPVALSRSGLRAPAADLEAPRVVDREAVVPITAPNAFRELDEIGRQSFTAAQLAPVTPTAAGRAALGDATVNTEVTGAWLGGFSAEAGGADVGAVPCLQSAFVIRYLKHLEDRTYARWNVPAGTPSDQKIVLRFDLDATGSATQVEVQRADDPALGRSAVLALRSASPFPPMDDNVRCLSELRLTGTFTNPPL